MITSVISKDNIVTLILNSPSNDDDIFKRFIENFAIWNIITPSMVYQYTKGQSESLGDRQMILINAQTVLTNTRFLKTWSISSFAWLQRWQFHLYLYQPFYVYS